MINILTYVAIIYVLYKLFRKARRGVAWLQRRNEPRSDEVGVAIQDIEEGEQVEHHKCFYDRTHIGSRSFCLCTCDICKEGEPILSGNNHPSDVI